MKELIGKTITGLRVNEDQSLLVFDHPDGTNTGYETDADCCSETWFADITGVSALIGGVVRTADEVSMDGYNVNDGRGRQESDEAYGYKLTTDKGHVDIVFRNSSNGYYGGSINIFNNRLPENMVEITDDWMA